MDEVKRKTNLKIVERLDNSRTDYWISYNGSNGLLKIRGEGFITGVTFYGMNSCAEIMDELVTTFNTEFIDDSAMEEILHHDEEKDGALDYDKIYRKITLGYGYSIDENGIITCECDDDL